MRIPIRKRLAIKRNPSEDGSSSTVASQQAAASTQLDAADTGADRGDGAGAGLRIFSWMVAFRRTFASLEDPAFRSLWISMLLQGAAMSMQMMARGYYAYELTGSATLLGVITGTAAVPALAFGL